MALDLKIEIFACSMYYEQWCLKGVVESLPNLLQIYGDECYEVENCSDVLNPNFVRSVLSRCKMFRNIYFADFTYEKGLSFKSLSDCYNYVTSICDRDFGGLTVFERLFATSGFVLDFCNHIYKFNIVDVVKYGYMLWSMYFDKFIKEFYAEGGWEMLKVVSLPYVLLNDFFCLFNVEEFPILNEVIEDYCIFMKESDKNEDHVSKQWIYWRLKYLKYGVRTHRVGKVFFTTAFDVENLLENLKGLMIFISNDRIKNMKSENISDNYYAHLDDSSLVNVDREYKINEVLKVLSINQKDESLCYGDTPRSCIQNETNFYVEKCAIEETNIKNILVENCTFKNDKKVLSVSQTNKTELDRNFSHVPAQAINDLSAQKTGIQRDTSATPTNMCTNQINISSCHRKTLSCNATDTAITGPKKSFKGSIYEVCTKKISEMNYNANDEDKRAEAINRVEAASCSHGTEEKFEGNSDIPTKEYIEKLFSDCTNRQDKSLHATIALSTNQMGTTFSNRMPPHSLSDAILSSEKDLGGIYEDARVEKDLEICRYTKEINNRLEPGQTTEAEVNGKIFPSVSKRQFMDTNINTLSPNYTVTDYNNPIKTLSTNQMDANLVSKKFSQNSLPVISKPSSKKDGNSEVGGRTGETFEMTSNSKEEKDTVEISNKKEILSKSLVAEPKLDGKTTQHIFNKPEVLNSEKGYENIDREKLNIEKAREELEKERDDHDIKIFLGMILVLGDRDGTKSVLQALQNTNDDEKTQVKRKQKKKSKKKKIKE